MVNPWEGDDQPQDLRSEVFVYGRPHPDGSDKPSPTSILNFDDLSGRTFLLPMDENGERKQATISDHVHTLDETKLPEKTTSGSDSKLRENNLMILSPTTNSWSIWRTPWILDKPKTDSTNSSPS